MDVEKTIQFILEQQAGFASGLQQLREEVRSLTANVRGLTQNYLGLVEVQAHQQAMLNQLVGTVGQLASQLATYQQRTEERFQDFTEKLNALIKVVDDLIRRDGRPS